jgi:hypothetical protein
MPKAIVCLTGVRYHASLALQDDDGRITDKFEYAFVYSGHSFRVLEDAHGVPSQGNKDRMASVEPKTPVLWRDTEPTLDPVDEIPIAAFSLVGDLDRIRKSVLAFALAFDASPEPYHIVRRNCRTFVARALVEGCGVPPEEVHKAFAKAGARVGVCTMGLYCPVDCGSRILEMPSNLTGLTARVLCANLWDDAKALGRRVSLAISDAVDRVGAGQDPEPSAPAPASASAFHSGTWAATGVAAQVLCAFSGARTT